MVASQFNIRVSSRQRAKIMHNARTRGIKPTEYVRSLIDRDDKDVTGPVLIRRLRELARKEPAPLVFAK